MTYNIENVDGVLYEIYNQYASIYNLNNEEERCLRNSIGDVDYS